jgi:hypothetical protein
MSGFLFKSYSSHSSALPPRQQATFFPLFILSLFAFILIFFIAPFYYVFPLFFPLYMFPSHCPADTLLAAADIFRRVVVKYALRVGGA